MDLDAEVKSLRQRVEKLEATGFRSGAVGAVDQDQGDKPDLSAMADALDAKFASIDEHLAKLADNTTAAIGAVSQSVVDLSQEVAKIQKASTDPNPDVPQAAPVSGSTEGSADAQGASATTQALPTPSPVESSGQ